MNKKEFIWGLINTEIVIVAIFTLYLILGTKQTTTDYTIYAISLIGSTLLNLFLGYSRYKKHK